MKKNKLDSTESQASTRVRFEKDLESLLSGLPSPAAARGGPWIVALSAGCDSTALCRLLHEAAGSPAGGAGSPAITAVHVNHALRGADADADEDAARALADALGFDFHCERLAPPDDLATGATEAWARTERYRILADAARDRGAPLVFTAHNKNDQAETVLARFMRRAGYWGLAGIRPWRPLAWESAVLVVRPLLAFGRIELERYLASLGQPFRHDRTNEEILFERNRIRHRLLPRLETARQQNDPSLTDTLCAIADLSRAIHTSLDRAADAMIEERSAREAPLDRIVCDAGLYARSPEMVRFAFLRRAALRLAPRQVPVKERSFRAIDRSIESGSRNKRWSLGNGLIVRRAGEDLVVEPASSPRRQWALDSAPLSLPVPGACTLPDGRRIRAAVYDDPTRARQPRTGRSSAREIVDAGAIGGPITIRTRRPGDTFHPLGARGGKKLKSILIDAKIPAAERAAIPLVCSGDEIVWVVGVRIAHAVRVTERTTRFLCLTLEEP